jgi:adenylosuccinate synthase
VRQAIDANGGPEGLKVALTMTDHVVPAVRGMKGTRMRGELDMDLQTLLHRVEGEIGVPVSLIGTGPDTMTVIA